jgi:adenosylmethionine-8-amino-7-oxononanoate aminotransferase
MSPQEDDGHAKLGRFHAKKIVGKVKAELEGRGVFTRNVRDILCVAPPRVITAAQVDRLVEATRGAIAAVLLARASG